MQFLYVARTHSRGTLLPRRTVPGGSWGAPDSIEVRTRMEGEKKKKKEEKKKEFEATRYGRKKIRGKVCAKKHAMRQFVTELRNCGSTFQTDLYTVFILVCNCFLALIKYYLFVSNRNQRWNAGY